MKSRVRKFTIVIILGLVTALLYHRTLEHFGFPWPWTSFLYERQDQLNDWHNSVRQAAAGDPYHSTSTPALAAYFPAAYLIFGAVSGLNWFCSSVVFLTLSAVFLLLAIVSVVRDSESRVLLLCAFLASYPILFALDRGNLDLWVACACTLFVATLDTRAIGVGVGALVIATSVKGYPMVFLTLLVVRREFRWLAAAVFATALVSFAAMLSFRGSLLYNVEGLMTNLSLFQQRYVLGGGSLFASSDPYNAIRLWMSGLGGGTAVGPGTGRPRLEALSLDLLTVYTPLIATFSAISILFVTLVPCAVWRRVTAISLVAILFPNVANDYKLCCLLPGVLLLLVSGCKSRREDVALVLFALLMIPKSYYFFRGHPVSMFINPILLLGLAWNVLVDRTAWRRGRRLFRFRILWYAAALPWGPFLIRRLNGGKPLEFLCRPHASLAW